MLSQGLTSGLVGWQKDAMAPSVEEGNVVILVWWLYPTVSFLAGAKEHP